MAHIFMFLVGKITSYTEKYISKRGVSIRDMLRQNWFLGLTCFGGPAVHFQIFRQRFVDKCGWISDDAYKEMFALCQALPGPGSTKMIYAINVIHGGYLVGMLSFLIWSLPGAIAAYALAVGVNRISDTLPSVVYALLSGLNAATVGIIALAAVQLSQKAATDKITRILVFLGGSAGLLYNTLWYFPVLMVLGAVTTVVWDYRWCHNAVNAARARMKRSRNRVNTSTEEGQAEEPTMLQDVIQPEGLSDAVSSSVQTGPTTSRRHPSLEETEQQVEATPETNVLSWKFGVTVISCFFLTFIIIMVVRGTVQNQPFGFRVFANLYLAGTIIFGGGPVVIPLLREYVVAEGWVSPRNFLLGLAICQAYPGPNFNFAVYLGALAVAGHLNAATGAIIGYIAIFGPGIILHAGTMSLWKTLRNIRWFVSALRGINATAVGLIYTAVYRLWEQGFLSETFASGSSLGLDPWWLVVTATSFVGGHWFNVPAPATIVLGGVMGIVWYGVTKT